MVETCLDFIEVGIEPPQPVMGDDLEDNIVLNETEGIQRENNARDIFLNSVISTARNTLFTY